MVQKLLTQRWSWAMLGCNLHSKHCIVPQPIPMFVQPRFGAPHNPRWRYVIKVYHLNSKTNMNKAKSPCYLLKQCSCLVQDKKMWLPVNDVQAKIQREMFFVLSRAWDKEKKIWVPMKNRTSDLRIPRSDALPLSHIDSTVSEVYYEVHMMTRVLHTARISNVDSVMFVDRNKRDGKAEGLRFDSSLRLRFFSLYYAHDKTKNIFLYFFTELKIYHHSYFYLQAKNYVFLFSCPYFVSWLTSSDANCLPLPCYQTSGAFFL